MAPDRDRTIDWPAIKAAYAVNDMTVDDICTTFGVSRSGLYQRARAEGWKRRIKRPNTDRNGRSRIARLYAALDKQVADVERRLAKAQGEGNGSKAGDRERDARTLATLARTLEKLNAMTPEVDQEDDESPPEDIEEFRRELSRRLAELRRQGGD